MGTLETYRFVGLLRFVTDNDHYCIIIYQEPGKGFAYKRIEDRRARDSQRSDVPI